MKSLHLEEQWCTESVGTETEWNKVIRERIHMREQVRWRAQCLIKPKLRTYSILKRELRQEPYLDVFHRRGIPELAKVRGGTNRLRIEKGRYTKEAVEERICQFCDSKQVEDEFHFMLECRAYEDLRDQMWSKVEEVTKGKRTSFPTKEHKLNALIGDQFQPKVEEDKTSDATKKYHEIAKAVMKYITQAMDRRRGLIE
jgi:hypothetical protein